MKQVPVKGAPVQSSPWSRQPIVHSGNYIEKKKSFFQEFYIDHFINDNYKSVYTKYIIYDIYVLILLVPLKYSAVKLVYTVNMLYYSVNDIVEINSLSNMGFNLLSVFLNVKILTHI